MAKKRKRSKKRGANHSVSNKIAKIMHEGVRRNTRRAVSKSNPRRKVGIKQAVAIAMSMKRRGKA